MATQESKLIKVGKALDDASGKMKSAGKSMTSAGTALTVGVTMPIIGVGVAAANMGMEFEAQMSRVKAISGATGDEFKQLNDLAIKLGADTVFSSKQAAEGMENLASAGFNTTEIMAAMPGMLDLAASGGLDLALASDIAASSLRSFGLEASQSGHVADVLAKAAADTNAQVEDMSLALKYASAPAHALGMSLEETSAAIGIMANAGIKGEMAGTTLRGSLVSLASPSKEAADMMKEIGFNAFDANGKMLPFKDVIDRLRESTKNLSDEQKANALATIFGRESLSGMMVLVGAGGGKLDELTKSFKDSNGAAEKMAKTMKDNTKGSIEQMKGSIETAAIKLTTALAPSIIKVADKISQLADKFSQLNPATQETIVKSLALAAALGPVLAVGGNILSIAGPVVGVVGKIATGLGGASIAAQGATAAVGATATGLGGVGAAGGAAALLLNPVTLGIAAVGVAAVGTAYLLNQKVIPTVDLFGKNVSDATKKAVNAYMDLDKKVGVSLLSFKANNTVITTEIAKDMITTFENMGNQIKQGRDKHYAEDLETLKKFYTEQGTINTTEAQATLAKMTENNIAKNALVNHYESQIKAIYENAATNHRTITQEEETQIKTIKDNMRALAISALTQSETEQNTILNRMRLQAGNISTLEASEVIAASARQRDETIRLANDQYQQTVNSITRQRDEGIIKSDGQAQSMIAAAQRTRDAAIGKAQEMHSGVVSELERQNSDIAKKLNASDGTVKTWWQKLKSWFAGNPINPSINPTWGQMPSAPSGKAIPAHASGTNNFRGGYTTLHEKGWELYDLPRGTRIYNHEASEDLVLKSAQEVVKGVLSSMQNNISSFPAHITLDVPIYFDSRQFSRFQYDYEINQLAGGGVRRR